MLLVIAKMLVMMTRVCTSTSGNDEDGIGVSDDGSVGNDDYDIGDDMMEMLVMIILSKIVMITSS